MSRIRSKDTSPELKVRKYLYSKGIRYRLHRKDLPGKPDIVLRKFNTVIFIHGCFWHQHQNCKNIHIPKTNSVFWSKKLKKNIERDINNNQLLQQRNWIVKIIWECQTGNIQFLDEICRSFKNDFTLDHRSN